MSGLQDCSRYDEMLSAFVDGELSESETRALRAHLESCADCRDYLRLLETMHEGLSQALPDPPQALRRGVMYKLGLEKKRRFGIFGHWAVSAAVFCIVLLGVIRLTGNDLRSIGGAAADAAITVAGSFDYMRETSTAASTDSNAVAAASPMPEPDSPEEAAQAVEAPGAPLLMGIAPADTGDAEVAEEAAIPDSENDVAADGSFGSIYDASTLRGYAAGMDALQEEESYAAVGILYALQEGLPDRQWKAQQDAPAGQRRWLVKKSVMDRLAESNTFDELYYGDLLAENGLIIELTDEED